jgi:hypothetical protein
MLRSGVACAAVIAVCALLAGCGGGGSSGSTGGGGPPPPPASPPTLSLNATAIATSADVAESAAVAVPIQVSVANAPATTLQYTVSVSGTGVAGATFSWQSSSQGTLTVTFPAPAPLGTGTFSGLVHLSVCQDSACTQPISGAPVDIPVTYLVLPPTTFLLNPQGAISYTAQTAVTTPQTASFELILSNAPNGLFVGLYQPAKGGFITSATANASPDSNGAVTVQFDMSLVSPASLGSGYFNSSLVFALCYDQACTEPVTGSPVTVQIFYVVTLTPGQEYTVANFADAAIADLAYDPVDQNLYVAGIGGYNSALSGKVAQLNPVTGAAGTQVALNDGLTHVAASADGSYLYVGSATNPVIYRLDLPALTSNLNIPLGTASDGNANVAAQLAVAPGAPHTVAVALGEPTGPHTGGTEVFDDAVARTNSMASLGFYAQPDSIAWGDSASQLYAYRYSSQIPFDQEIDQVAASAAGLSVTGSTNLTGGADPVVQVRYGGGNLYDFGGYVYNAATLAPVGQYALPAPAVGEPQLDQIVAVIPDPANGHTFVLTHDADTSHLVLLTYDLSSFALQSIIDFGYDSFDVNITTHMILWGSNGIAFNRGGVLQMLAGSFVAVPTASAAKASRRSHLLTVRLAPQRPRGAARASSGLIVMPH